VRKFRKKPGFLSLREGRETGFLSRFRMGCKNSGKNPVSRVYARGQKPGFYQNLGWCAKIQEKTRFLESTPGARNRVFIKV